MKGSHSEFIYGGVTVPAFASKILEAGELVSRQIT
jgi:hypothetical protein